MFSKAILLVALGLSLANAKTSWGKCQDVTLVSDFDATDYAGNWYEIYRDKNAFFEWNAECVTASYPL